jgi:SAM-dependent methyltransferase
MQAYSQGFAQVYNLKWGSFARQAAPFLLDFYAATPAGQQKLPVLDLCCGTGQLAVAFLEKGYRVVGLDSSHHMLHYARENAQVFLPMGQAAFIQGDASHFTLAERFGLVVSTYDALNHLDNFQMLTQCFQCAREVCAGVFIFDLNTRLGLRRWNTMLVDDSADDIFLVNRGIYDGQSAQAWMKITGFRRLPTGFYERFDETAFNTAFDLTNVKQALLAVGWRGAYFARLQDLQTPLVEPENEGRVFVVATP